MATRKPKIVLCDLHYISNWAKLLWIVCISMSLHLFSQPVITSTNCGPCTLTGTGDTGVNKTRSLTSRSLQFDELIVQLWFINVYQSRFSAQRTNIKSYSHPLYFSCSQVLPKMTSHVVNEIDNILRNKPYSKKDYRS